MKNKLGLTPSELRFGKEYGTFNEMCDRMDIFDPAIRLKAATFDRANPLRSCNRVARVMAK
jgi:hypothetical protein